MRKFRKQDGPKQKPRKLWPMIGGKKDIEVYADTGGPIGEKKTTVVG